MSEQDERDHDWQQYQAEGLIAYQRSIGQLISAICVAVAVLAIGVRSCV